MKKKSQLKLFAFFTIWIFACITAVAKDRIIVAQDGSGDYRTVQAAINAVPDHSSHTVTIFIKKGTYKEKITLPEAKTNITLIGESRDETIITYDDFAQKPDSTGKNIGTSGSSSFFVYGNDFSAVNLTFQNSAGPVGQAVAMRVTGTRAYFQNCRFLGFQDTLYTHGFGTVELYRDCYIEGTVDFIFGAATAWFEDCSIFCKKGGGYISAAATPDTVKYGYVFYNCRVAGDAPAHTVYLGRPWRPYAKTVYIKCDLGDRIIPAAWLEWSNKDNHSTTYYARYGNKGDNSLNPPDWTHMLTDQEAKQYQRKQVLGGWDPHVVK